MSKEDQHVEFRSPTPVPTVAGIYYAQRHGFEGIEPVRVSLGWEDAVSVWCIGGDRWWNPKEFTFFGPVREVRQTSVSISA